MKTATLRTLRHDFGSVFAWVEQGEPLPFTPLHRHELRNAIRLRVFRGEITPEQRKLAFQEIESDLLRNRGAQE
jgi:hypothetical protein